MIKESGKGKIAVIGERNISLGFKLIGIADSFDVEGQPGIEMLLDFMNSREYSMILVSSFLIPGRGINMIRGFVEVSTVERSFLSICSLRTPWEQNLLSQLQFMTYQTTSKWPPFC